MCVCVCPVRGVLVLDSCVSVCPRWLFVLAGRRVDGLEARVSALLEGRLRAARTAEEMFRVFAKFNPLFVRPRCLLSPRKLAFFFVLFGY